MWQFPMKLTQWALSFLIGSSVAIARPNSVVGTAGDRVIEVVPWDYGEQRHERAGLEARMPRRLPPPFEFPSQEEINKAERSGQMLRCGMDDPTSMGSVASSKWSSWSSLKDWGWEAVPNAGTPWIDDSGVMSLVSSNPGVEINIWHLDSHYEEEEADDRGEVKTVKYPPTNAQYDNVYWPDKGVILVNEAYGPRYQVDYGLTPQQRNGHGWADNDRIPQLSQWSDVTWLTWKHHADLTERRSLRYVLIRQVRSAATRNMLAYVLRLNFHSDDPVGRAPYWDHRRKITSEMQGFEALLSTPNIRGVCWLLIQHRAELGSKRIKSITVYEAIKPTSRLSTYAPDMLVEIESFGEVNGEMSGQSARL